MAALLLMGALAASITCARDFSRHAGGAANAVTVDSVTPPSGANTADVTITVKGTNFAGSHEVYVGASACTGVVLVSRNLLNAVVPAGLNEGSYNVTVISSQNGTGVGQSAYAVVDPTLIEVSSVTPVEGVNDVETPVTITGAHFVAPVTVDLGAFALLSAEVTAAGNGHGNSPVGAGRGRV
ncbi:MAG: IPT/TIG domain-containing protein [Deltaproteobacteria bacterium]|nr:IPT/TIG domain-containing protein [Deltaproteobacteria bacterium]